MAASRFRLRKGGLGRWVISNTTDNDYFTVPRGFRITYIAAETLNTISAANITVGASIGTYTTANFTVTSVASATTGTLTWGGGASGTITLAAGDILTTAAVAAKIASTGSSTGYSVVAIGSTVYLTSLVPANVSAPTIALGTATNITFGTVTTIAGAIDTSVVTATALGTAKGSVTALAVNAGKDYTASSAVKTTVFTFGVSSATAGTILINGISYSLTGGNVASANALATAIGAFYVPNYTLTVSTNTVTFTALSEGTGIGFPTIVLGTATGITQSQVNTPADRTLYVNFSAVGAEGNTNLYVILQKLN